MIEGEVGSSAIEPCGDASELVGEFAIERNQRAVETEQSKIMSWSIAELRQFAWTPSGLEAAMIEGHATEGTEVDVDAARPSELVESTLPSEGDRQRCGAVADIGSLFEPFFTSEGRDSLGKGFEEEVRFECEASYRSFHHESVLIGIDPTGAGAHRDTELCCGAGRITERTLADSARTSTQRNRSVDRIDNTLRRRT